VVNSIRSRRNVFSGIGGNILGVKRVNVCTWRKGTEKKKTRSELETRGKSQHQKPQTVLLFKRSWGT